MDHFLYNNVVREVARFQYISEINKLKESSSIIDIVFSLHLRNTTCIFKDINVEVQMIYVDTTWKIYNYLIFTETFNIKFESIFFVNVENILFFFHYDQGFRYEKMRRWADTVPGKF